MTMAHLPVVGAPAPVLAVINGIPTTTSLDVARHFGKRHDRVLRAIRASLAPEALNIGIGAYVMLTIKPTFFNSSSFVK
jgi:hypothetical protein